MKDTKNDSQSSAAILRAAYSAWSAGSSLRADRSRNKRFTYGDQWSDMTCDCHGRSVTEYERYSEDGGAPATNNLIRQLVKTIVGRFRSEHIDVGKIKDARVAGVHASNQLDELDSRALEEFLISGCCVQRVDIDSGLCERHVRVDNVNLNRFFINAIVDPLARDCEIVGQIHDLSVADLVKRVSCGSRGKAAWVRRLYSENADSRVADFMAATGGDTQSGTDFWLCASNKCRAIEVWTLESREVIVCHNRLTAELFTLPVTMGRKVRNKPGIDARWDIAKVWHCRWFSPMGDVLIEYDSPFAHGTHPFIVKMYPLTDGEVHSFVEDVIDQQKYVNRLVTLIDHIMMASAKGVLLFPDTALPDGFTWDDVRRVWSNCNGILPYSPFQGGEKPEQISVNATNIGAYNMIALQMKLLEEISGVQGALQGKNVDAGNSATLYENEARNASVALTDVFDTFNTFRRQRDSKVLSL
jgi:hypothetical protein